MEIPSPSEFTTICRTCLSKNRPLAILKEQVIANIFTQVTKLEVQDDRLPQGICPFCLCLLKNVNNFILKCRKVDNILRLALEQNAINDSCTENDKALLTEIHPETNANNDSNTIELIRREGDNNDEIESHTNSPKNEKPSDEFLEYEKRVEIDAQRQKLRHHYIQNEIKKVIRFNCNICLKGFSRKSKLQDHMRCHTKDTPFKCMLCSKTFRYSQNLRRHKRINHEGVKPFDCHICHKGFSSTFNRDEHVRTHTGETPFLCPYCGIGFKSYANHRVHVIRHKVNRGELPKPVQNKDATCEKCDKTFSSKSALQTHKVLHTGKRPFLCNVCGKNFSTNGALRTHFITHTGIRRYQCATCGKSFTQKGGLKKHALIHMGLKQYSCHLCEKSFIQSAHLTTHLRTHTGERPYVCSYCNRRFAANRCLKAHMKIHKLDSSTT